LQHAAVYCIIIKNNLANIAIDGSLPVTKKSPKHFENRLQQLRDDAEARLSKTSLPEPLAVLAGKDKLLHELQIYQIELEMQNEQLRQAHDALTESRDRYLDLYEFSPVGYITLTADGLLCETNLKTAAMFGIERKKLISRRFAHLVADHDKDRWHFQLLRMKQSAGGEEQDLDLMLKREDGYCFQTHVNCLRMDDMDAPQMIRLAITDITKLRAAELELRIAAIAFESQEGIMITDVNNVILRVNQAFTTMTGYSSEEALGKNPRMLCSGRQSKEFYAEMWTTLYNTGAWEGEIWNRRKNGVIYPERLTITAVKDEAGVTTNYVSTLTDITMSRAASDEIKHLAFYDPLTQLPNRRLLLDRLNQALATSARSRRHGALLFLDLDYFKTLNDTLGHDVGDLLLQQVAERLTACIREGDTVARFGGDEFVMLLEDLSEIDIEAAAQTEAIGNKVLALLNQAFHLAAYEHHCTISIGATLFNGHEAVMDELLKQADIAMYQAKESGRNALSFFDHHMQELINAHVSLEQELRKAEALQQFELYYQVQVDQAGKALGAEALIRWHHPARGLVLPAEFIPLAEEGGLILAIGQWVLDAACAQLQKWQADAAMCHLTLSVNVSSKQIYKDDFVQQVQASVTRFNIDPKLLKLELTESMLVEGIDQVAATMSKLAENGIRFSLDDFGTGYSSLQYLKMLPLYQLKIDQSFVRDIAIDSSDRAIVRTIVAMAHSLDLGVIAEGVETAEQRTLLLNKGCKHFQGYLFSQPLPIAEFEALVQHSDPLNAHMPASAL
jgi:diguanylate cyclase (GGDEF)-like protein/PAS domain S-box-containing protein